MGVSREANPKKNLKVGDMINKEMSVNNMYPVETQNDAIRHEAGHGIFAEARMGKGDLFTRGGNYRYGGEPSNLPTPQIPDDIAKQMRRVYHDLSKTDAISDYKPDVDAWGNLSPENLGYSSSHTNHELFAEFFKAATRDPNYVKSVAPEAYEWMARMLDEDPHLSKVVQMNSIGGGLAGLLAMKMMEEQEGQQ